MFGGPHCTFRGQPTTERSPPLLVALPLTRGPENCVHFRPFGSPWLLPPPVAFGAARALASSCRSFFPSCSPTPASRLRASRTSAACVHLLVPGDERCDDPFEGPPVAALREAYETLGIGPELFGGNPFIPTAYTRTARKKNYARKMMEAIADQ